MKKYWCPNGCGKQVWYKNTSMYGGKRVIPKVYSCDKCNHIFTKEELNKLNKKKDENAKTNV